MGVGRMNGDLFPDPQSRCVVMSYDYTVLAGTQGKKNHQKNDRMIGVAERADCRSCCSPRAAAGDRATPRRRAIRGGLPTFRRVRGAERAGARW